MERSNRENEVKLAFASPETAVSRLLAAGAQEVHPRAFEDNLLFDLPGGQLEASGRLLRLRHYGDGSLLTFKAPVEGEHRHKVKIEHEMVVADPEAMRAILRGLGFAIVYRYQKYRTVFRLGRVTASVDETPIGTYVELEGEADDVDWAAKRVGAQPSDYILATYRDLHDQDAAS